MLGLPATIGLTFASVPIVQTLFEHGKFNHDNTLATASALQAYALGIPAFLLVKVFAACFFARHDTSTPVKVAFIAMFTNVLLSISLLKSFEHVGIAFANTLAVWINAGFLFWQLRKKQHNIGDSKLLKRMPRIFLSALGMAAITYLLVVETETWFAANSISREILGLSAIIGLSSTIYGLLLQLTGAMRIQEIRAILQRKPID